MINFISLVFVTLKTTVKKIWGYFKTAATQFVSAESNNIEPTSNHSLLPSTTNSVPDLTLEGPVSTLETEGTINEAPFSPNPDFLTELSRLLSFPDSQRYVIKSVRAKIGLYWEGGRARCNFCPFVEGGDVSGEHANCPLDGNVPIGGNIGNFRYETNRLLSFLTADWPQLPTATHPVGCLDLARSGFHYTGNGDVARCVFCRLEVRGWEEGDTAESEHRRWNPQCAFLQGREVDNVTQGEEAEGVQQGEEAEGVQHDDEGEGVQHDVVDCASVNIDQRFPTAPTDFKEALTTVPPKYAEYSSLGARLKSFAIWPVGMAQTPQVLSEAGFFYTGTGDRVICYQCGGGLKDWGPEDTPWVEHAVWFPQCTFLIAVKGAEFVDKVQKDKKDTVIVHVERPLQPPRPENMEKKGARKMADNEVRSALRASQDGSRGEENFVSLANEAKLEVYRNNGLFCLNCSAKELGVVFLSCDHMAACTDCAPQLPTCPICGAKIKANMAVFLP